MSTRATLPALRLATLDDVSTLKALIVASATGLGAADYTPEQIRGALAGVFGVDRQLIEDGTYFVAEHEGRIVGCGGWSLRRTRFGGDAFAERDPSRLDPGAEAARVRAFFVDPACARSGIARTLLARCEDEAARAGFRAMELMATLTGVHFYASQGYTPGVEVDQPLDSGDSLRLVSMRKELNA